MLIVKKISKLFRGHEIIKNVSFCLKKGEVMALLGPNGAGKTTLMRCIIGFYYPDEGDVLLDDISVYSDRKNMVNKIAYVPENGGIYPEMNVFEYLSFMASIKHVKNDEFKKRCRSIIKDLELESVLDQRCEALSKGYKRRVALAGALLAKPELLILDEPTEGLDPRQKKQVRDILRRYTQKGMVLISTHIMEEVEVLADRVLLINEGKVICDTTPEDMKKATPYNTIENSFCTILGN